MLLLMAAAATDALWHMWRQRAFGLTMEMLHLTSAWITLLALVSLAILFLTSSLALFTTTLLVPTAISLALALHRLWAASDFAFPTEGPLFSPPAAHPSTTNTVQSSHVAGGARLGVGASATAAARGGTAEGEGRGGGEVGGSGGGSGGGLLGSCLRSIASAWASCTECATWRPCSIGLARWTGYVLLGDEAAAGLPLVTPAVPTSAATSRREWNEREGLLRLVRVPRTEQTECGMAAWRACVCRLGLCARLRASFVDGWVRRPRDMAILVGCG